MEGRNQHSWSSLCQKEQITGLCGMSKLCFLWERMSFGDQLRHVLIVNRPKLCRLLIDDKKFGLIQEYADNYRKLTDEQSLSFVRRWLDSDIQVAQLRQKYVPIVSKVLDGKKSATFFQLDRRIAMMIELQLSSRMPLVQSQ
jgi:hypothetical protein